MSTTKYLRKAIFINSAQITYQEVALDGNVHFIGTQGTGKSTVQRALLFFYTASSRRSKLGLSASQKSFVDYYFPYENAYLIYEIGCMVNKDGVEKDIPEESFMVIVFKRTSGVRFLFVRSNFNKKFFLAEDGMTVLLPQDMQRQLSEQRRYTSPVIDSAIAYRDILYGKNRQHTAFSLFRSNAYENIPQTIEKIFLNAGLNSDAIKTTIIDSAILHNVSEFELESHKKQLRDFDEVKQQVITFHNNRPQVGNFLNRYQKILNRRALLEQLAIRIFHAVHGTKQQVAVYQEEIAQVNRQVSDIEQLVQQASQAYQHERDGLKQQIGLLERDIVKGKALLQKYESMNIAILLEQHQQENSYRIKKEGLEQQRLTLTEGVRSVEERYKAERKQVQQQFAEQRLSIETTKQGINKKALEQKDSLREDYDCKRDALEKQYASALEQQQGKTQEASAALQEAQQLEYQARHHQPLKEEMEAEVERKQQLFRRVQQLEIGVSRKEQKAELDRERYKMLENEEAQAVEQLRQELEPNIQALTIKTEELEVQVGKLENALYGFLQENVPQWENGIGKVIDEQLLFLPASSISYDSSQSYTLLGLSLPLEELPNLHGPKDYAADLVYYQHEKEQSILAYKERLEALKKRYEGKKKYATEQLRLLNKELEQERYDSQQVARKMQACDQAIATIESNAKAVFQKGIAQAEAKLQESRNNYQQALKEEANIKTMRQKELADIKQAQQIKLARLREQTSNEIQQQDLYLKKRSEEEEKALNELRGSEYKELSNHQLDTDRIAGIDLALVSVSQKLEAIYKNRDTVVAYQKDYPEYIASISEHERMVEVQGEKLKKLDYQYHQKNTERKQQITQLYGQQRQLKQEVDNWLLQLRSFEESMTPSKVWDAYKPFFPEETKPSSERKIAVLCRQLNDEYYALKEEEKSVFEACMQYVGKFPEDNVFGFKRKGNAPAQQETLLSDIQQYVKEERIIQLETELGHKFSLMLKRINKDYELLLSQRQTVDLLVSRINRSFRQGNFVGAVKSLEMKTMPSRSNLIQELQHINEFIVSHGHDIGEADLFANADRQQSANEKAVKLLERFYEAMVQSKMTVVKLSDTFELQFRIQENENDTGWLENVRSVGSNGTDVLVKAMVYITLLQVFKEQVANIKSNTQRQIVIWLHCIIDEVGILHDSNIQGLANFANERGIWLINGSPNANDAASYRHIYQFRKGTGDKTQIIRLLSKQKNKSDVE